MRQEGHLFLIHAPASPGVNYLGSTLPIVDEDESNKLLTCMPHLTAEDFYNSPEHVMMARAFGLGPAPAALQRYFLKAGDKRRV